MHELLRVLSDRKGQAWILVTALFYVLVLVPFNQYQWVIAGISVRPAAILPVVCGIFWGPAAAWGLCTGNIVGDLFGSWSPMSIVGCIANFLYPYISYRLWHRLMQGREIRMDTYALGCFWAVTFLVTFACMLLLAVCGTLFFGRPFESKFYSYFSNSIIWAMIGGPILFWLLYEPAVRNRFVYGDQWNRVSQKAPS
ncbi:QueT transporter family protein [Methanoregula sp.]|uniref:QueT transporter family protein n=1 Tax=Methanoregula sp. TaxID=2052170 RepID=UPI002375DDE0|nr:QueT transporter family protein [Methanoregula sp.]MDD1686319.1 QueT transporter family protein [Methanoregula sp.]